MVRGVDIGKELTVKKLMLVSLSIALIMPVFALATCLVQGDDQTKQGDTATKVTNIPGKISPDGETFISDADGKTWTISNPDAIKGHEGHHVLLEARIDMSKREVRVVSVKMLKDSKTDTNMQK